MEQERRDAVFHRRNMEALLVTIGLAEKRNLIPDDFMKIYDAEMFYA